MKKTDSDGAEVKGRFIGWHRRPEMPVCLIIGSNIPTNVCSSKIYSEQDVPGSSEHLALEQVLTSNRTYETSITELAKIFDYSDLT